jgi:hypothetical protein
MLKGRRVLEAAPVFDQTAAFWTVCKRILREPIAAGIVRKNETDRTLDLDRGHIRAKTAWDADTLRGDYADLLILDEYSLMKPSTWDEVGAPMLLDNDGDALFIFTPKRKNHAFSLYARAMGDTTGRWQAWHGTSLDNPYLSKIALAEITGDMTEEAYKQEILAEFLDSEGAVFRNIAACMTAPTPARIEDHQGHAIYMGCDWGRQKDYTAISLVCAPCRVEVARDRFNTLDYHVQRQRLRTLYDRWHVTSVLAESNAMGDPIITELQREGMRVVPFPTTAQTKPPLIEALALALERSEVRWQPDPIWTSEIEAYECAISPVTGRSSYSAPEGVHDDTVMARALALRAMARRGIGFL